MVRDWLVSKDNANGSMKVAWEGSSYHINESNPYRA
jgi:hypothetical protein